MTMHLLFLDQFFFLSWLCVILLALFFLNIWINMKRDVSNILSLLQFLLTLLLNEKGTAWTYWLVVCYVLKKMLQI